MYVLPVARCNFISAASAAVPAPASAGFAAVVTVTFSLPGAASVATVIFLAIFVSADKPYVLAMNWMLSAEPKPVEVLLPVKALTSVATLDALSPATVSPVVSASLAV